MKRMIFISALYILAATSFAGNFAAQPESVVPTPAERAEVSKEAPNLGAKENADWQKMRAERKQAREEILSNLRNRSKDEKRELRQGPAEKKNEKPFIQGEKHQKNPHEQEPALNKPEFRDNYINYNNVPPVRDFHGPVPCPWIPHRP